MKTIPLLIVFISSFMLISQQAFGFGAGADNFNNATPIIGPSNYSTDTNLLSATEEANEPNHAPDSLSSSRQTVWWTFTPSDDGYCTIDTQRSLGAYNGATNTTVAVYTGSDLNSLTRVASSRSAPLNASNISTALAQVRFFALKNTTYRIVADGTNTIAVDQYNVVLRLRHLPLKKASYTSLVSMPATYKQMGMISVNTTATGSLTAKLTLGLKTFSFAGAFNLDGRFSTTFIPKGTKITTPVTMIIDGVYNPAFCLQAFGEDMSEALLIEKRVYSSSSLNTTVGTFNAASTPLLPLSATSHAILTFKVKTNGTVSVVGFAPDGSSITASGNIHYPFQAYSNPLILYKSLNKGNSDIILVADVVESGATDSVNGLAIFQRSPSTGSLYPTGLNMNLEIKGATYVKPASNTRPYGFLNPTGDGFSRLPNSTEIPGGIEEAINLGTNNKFTFASASPAPAIKLNPATGLVTGSMVLPNGTKSTVKGILLLDGGVPIIKGYATGTAEHHGLTISNP